jgi:Fe-S cluster assembly iron-binding protein IscA
MPDQMFFLRVTAIEDDGIKYQTYFDYERRSDDTLIRFEGFDLRIDSESLKYLDSATLDYNEEQGFILDHSNT